MWGGAGEGHALCVHIVRVSHNRKAVIFSVTSITLLRFISSKIISLSQYL